MLAPANGSDTDHLRNALRKVMQSYAWHAFGECRSFGIDTPILSPSDASALARQALAANHSEPPNSCQGVAVRLTILGEPASKANSRQIVTIGRDRRPAIIKSRKARDYERAALLQIPADARRRFSGSVRVTMHLYYASERPDIDESIVLDVLQDRWSGTGDRRKLARPGVYRNDRQVREKHIYWRLDPSNPRAEIIVEPLQQEMTL